MSPDEVLAKHTSRQLNEWAAFFKLEEIDHNQKMEKAKLQQQVSRRRRGR